MGFETWWNSHWCKVHGSLKYPYGIWNFAKSTKSCRSSTGLKYPYGIWNYSMKSPAIGSYPFEVSLWDLKRDPVYRIEITDEFEVSLWDLKHRNGNQTQWKKWSLKYPYGIWNNIISAPFFFYNRFEVSLWDLKLRASDFPWWQGNSLKYPYGIWNKTSRSIRTSGRWVWSIPMGFETGTHQSKKQHDQLFEVSLWDLKLCTTMKALERTHVWSIPMGFETFATCRWWSDWRIRLKYPYGIWNSLVIGLIIKGI